MPSPSYEMNLSVERLVGEKILHVGGEGWSPDQFN